MPASRDGKVFRGKKRVEQAVVLPLKKGRTMLCDNGSV